jgi:transcription initiation factor IIE alpha subunit
MKTDIIIQYKEIQEKRKGQNISPIILILEAKGILASDEVDDLIEYGDTEIQKYLGKLGGK